MEKDIIRSEKDINFKKRLAKNVGKGLLAFSIGTAAFGAIGEAELQLTSNANSSNLSGSDRVLVDVVLGETTIGIPFGFYLLLSGSLGSVINAKRYVEESRKNFETSQSK